MYVRVSLRDGRPFAEVLDIDDLTRLDVRLDAVDDAAAADALHRSGLGEIRDGHAWLAIDRLGASVPDDVAWQARVAEMITYAANHDWTDAGGTRVRAHLQRGDVA